MTAEEKTASQNDSGGKTAPQNDRGEKTAPLNDKKGGEGILE